MDSTFIKPLAAGAVAVAIDKFYLKETDLNKSLFFGGSVAAGALAGSILTPLVANIIPNLSDAVDEKTIVGRALEIGLGSAAGWVVNAKILHNADSYRENYIQRLGVIAVSDFAGEYIADYFAGRPLSYFA
jgi:hypothetical protein